MLLSQLTEGLTKVPTETKNKIAGGVLGHVLYLLYALARDTDDYESEAVIKRIRQRCESEYGNVDNIFKSMHNTFRVFMSMSSVDSRYLKRSDNKQRRYKINVTVTPQLDAMDVKGFFSKRTEERAAWIEIVIPSRSVLSKIVKNPELFGQLERAIVGTVEHELIHKIQNVAFDSLPSKMGYYKDGKIDDDLYFSDEAEFHPLIVSEVYAYKSFLQNLRRDGFDIDGDNRSAVLRKYVDPDAPDPDGFTFETRGFFAALKAKDVKKWKQAVKYFYGRVAPDHSAK